MQWLLRNSLTHPRHIAYGFDDVEEFIDVSLAAGAMLTKEFYRQCVDQANIDMDINIRECSLTGSTITLAKVEPVQRKFVPDMVPSLPAFLSHPPKM